MICIFERYICCFTEPANTHLIAILKMIAHRCRVTTVSAPFLMMNIIVIPICVMPLFLSCPTLRACLVMVRRINILILPCVFMGLTLCHSPVLASHDRHERKHQCAQQNEPFFHVITSLFLLMEYINSVYNNRILLSITINNIFRRHKKIVNL